MRGKEEDTIRWVCYYTQRMDVCAGAIPASTTQKGLHKRRISLVRGRRPAVTQPDEASEEDKYERKSFNSRILFNNLFREYSKLLEDSHTPHTHLTPAHMHHLLTGMYFVKDCHEDELVLIAHDVLTSSDQGVTVMNIFKLLLVVSNIFYDDEWVKLDPVLVSIISSDTRDKPIGSFDSGGDWVLEDHERLGIRKIFRKWHYNRLSWNRLKTFETNDDNSYSPQILDRSRKLAEKQRDRVRSFSKKHLLKSSSHQQLLILNKTFIQQKIQHVAEKLQQQQKHRCPFRPITNVRRKSVEDPKDRCLYLFNKSRDSSVSSHYRTSLEDRQNQSLKECTFHPTNLNHKMKLSVMPHVKNSQSEIDRMKKGLQMREVTKTLKERGYPRGIVNWTSFVNNYKKEVEYFPFKSKKSVVLKKTPILSIQVELSGVEQVVQVYEGDSLENLACKILVKNGLPEVYLGVVEAMIVREVEKGGRVGVRNGFLCEIG